MKRWHGLVLGLMVFATGCKKFVKNEVVQDSVRAKFKEQNWPVPSIACGGEGHKDGEKFTCPLTLADGQKGVLDVSIAGTTVNWKVKDLIPMKALIAKLVEGVQEKLSVQVNIDCPHNDVAFYPTGSVFTCTATAADLSKAPVEVTITDAENVGYSWKLNGGNKPAPAPEAAPTAPTAPPTAPGAPAAPEGEDEAADGG